MAESAWVTHPWVNDNRLRFGVASGPNRNWPQLVEFVQCAESQGYDAYWAVDHPIQSPGCWTTLAGLAAVTRSIRLGTLVNCVLYRGPAELARMAADVDRMSNGRLILGLGIGIDDSEFDRLGLQMPTVAERAQALEDTLLQVRRYWESDMAAPPVQAPRVPLLIAGGGEKRTLRQVAQYADAANFGGAQGSMRPVPAFGIAELTHKSAVLERYCREMGRPMSSVLLTKSLLPVVIAETQSRVQEKLQEVPERVRTRFQSIMVAGTPSDAVQLLRPLVEHGVSYLTFFAGNDLETLQLLARQVLPELEQARARLVVTA